ncbi:MAG: HEAT repeat domain-containing protein [Armatimonadetes bacterium]|nr:HEAT repeat domain-containing protein [Anaerolineae bacterium]
MENQIENQEERQVKPTLAITMASLVHGESSETVPATLVYGLSDLTPLEIAEFRPVWGKLDDEYRIKVMHSLAETSETNFEMNYRSIGLFGLSDDHPEVRQAAIEVLWEDESLELMERLIKLAREDDVDDVRAAALSALGRFILLGELGDLPEDETLKAQQIALKILDDKKLPAEVRRRALEAISNSSHDRLPALIKAAYRNDDRIMKVSAVFAMGKSCDDQWENIVLREIDNDDPEMRYEAARAAGELEIVDAVPALIALIETEDDREILGAAVWSLGEIGSREATRILERVLERAEQDGDDDMIEAAEDALGSATSAGSGLAL